MTWNDPFNNAYKKLFFNKAGTQLLGGILVGDASDYTTLLVSFGGHVREHVDGDRCPRIALAVCTSCLCWQSINILFSADLHDTRRAGVVGWLEDYVQPDEVVSASCLLPRCCTHVYFNRRSFLLHDIGDVITT